MKEVLFFGDSHLWTVRVEEKEQDALWSIVTRNPHPACSLGLEKNPLGLFCSKSVVHLPVMLMTHTMELLAPNPF